MNKIKILTALFFVALLFVNCKSDEKESTVDFKKLTENYFNEKNALKPLEATLNGQNQYNDQLQFEMTDSFRKKQGEFFDKYEQELATVNFEKLSEEEKKQL